MRARAWLTKFALRTPKRRFRAGLSSAGTTAQTLGVAQVIAKPLTRDTLLAAVRAIIKPAPLD
jgi:hypothetical protein